jgi:hypothetical protein
MFAGSFRSLPTSGAAERYKLALQADRIFWKGLPGTNTITYLQTFVYYGRKTLFNIEPWFLINQKF